MSFYSKFPPPAMVHLWALAFMSIIDLLIIWVSSAATTQGKLLHKAHFWTASKCIMGFTGLKDPPFFLRSEKVDTSGCTIHTITQKYVTSCSLIVAGCLNDLGVKQSLCTIFSGTPCTLVAYLATRWRHLHYLQIWPTDGAIYISCKFGLQMAPLA